MKSVHRSFLLGKLTKSDINGVNRPTYCLDVTLLTYGCRTLPACPGHASATRSIPTMLSLRSNTSLSAIVISDTGRSMDESRSTTDSRKEQRCSSKVQQSLCTRLEYRERERERQRDVIFIMANEFFPHAPPPSWSTVESSSAEGSRVSDRSSSIYSTFYVVPGRLSADLFSWTGSGFGSNLSG